MSNFGSIFAEYLNRPTPAPVNPGTTDNLSPDSSYKVAAAINSGNQVPEAEGQVAQDIATMTVPEFYLKYGPDAGNIRRSFEMNGTARFGGDLQSRRGAASGAWDTATSVGLGVANTVGGLGALAAGGINDDLGAAVSQKVGEFNNWVQDSQSGALASHRRANAALNEVTSENNRIKFENDRQTDGDFVAGLRRVGRDIIDTVSNAVSDPTMLADGTSNAIGSLLVGGPAGKAVRLAGAGLTGKLLARGVISEAAAIKAGQVGSKLAMPATIGAMESSGAYQQTTAEIMGMSHDQLMAGSPDYAELIANDWSEEDARTEVATSAGLTAAAITFPVAAAAGTLVSKFEANPFKGAIKGLGVIKNGASEAIEEAAQSGTGQFAGNVGTQAFADQNRDLTQGVGEQAGLGALYGFGSAVATQAPGTAINMAVEGTRALAKGTVAAGKAAVQPFVDRGDRINTERAAASPVSVENQTAAAETALAEAPAVAQQIQQDTEAGTLTPEQGQAMQGHLDKLNQTIAFDPAELTNTNLSPLVQTVLGSATNRFDALQKASQLATSKDVDVPSRIDAAIFINDTLNNVGMQLQNDLLTAVEAAPDDHPALDKLRGFEDVLINFAENTELQKARKIAADFVQRIQVKDVSEQAVATPKGQQAVKAILSVADSNPEVISGDIADLVLEHARKGLVKLSPVQSRVLSSSSALARVGNTYQLKAKKLELKPIDIVNRQILHDATGDDTREKSAAGHTKFVMDAVRAGDTGLAAERLDRMVRFAQHMQNKVNGLNQAYAEGVTSSNNAVKFEALTPNGKWLPASKGVYVSPTNEGSIGLAQRVALEAEALGTMANELAASMPELGIAPIQLAQLNPDLVGPAAKLAKQFQAKAVRKPEVAPITEPVAVEETAKVEPAQAEPSPVQTESVSPTAATEDTANPEPIEQETPTVERPEEKLPPEVSTTQRETADSKLQGYMATLSEDTGTEVSLSRIADNDAAALDIESADILERHGLKVADIVEDIVLLDGDVADDAATAFYAVPIIAFGRNFLTTLIKNPPVFGRVLSHELGHLLDNKTAGLRSSAPFFDMSRPLYQEFSTLRYSSEVSPLQMPRWDYIESHLKAGNNSEFFAEAASFVMLNPGLAKKLVPNVYKEIADAIAEAGGKIFEEALADQGTDSVSAERSVEGSGKEQSAKTVADAFPDLYENDKVQNWFKRAFKLPKEVRSRLFGTGSPATVMSEVFASHAALEAHVGTKLNKTLSSDLAQDYQKFMGMGNTVLETMAERLDDFLNAVLNKKTGVTFEQALREGLDEDFQVNGLARGKVLATVEGNDTEGFGYNQELAESAVFAGLQWALVSQNRKSNLDAEQVAKILGVDEAEAAPHVAWFNQGVPINGSKRDLANMISKYWGLQADRNMPEGYVKGIPESMAAEVLHGLMKAGLITISRREIDYKIYEQFVLNPENADLFDSLNRFPSAIEEAVLVEPENINHIGKAPTKVATTQLNGSPVALKEQQIQAQEVAQNIPHKLNTFMLDFYEMLGVNGIEGLFGRGKRTGQNVNVNTAKSIEGYNRTVTSAFKNLQNLVSEMQNYAETNGMDLADVETFFEYGISTVGRLQMQGLANPQSSKLVREVLLPTWATLDLSQRGSDHYNAFMLAMGQHLGVKVHKNSPEASIKQIEDELGDKFAGLIDTVESWTQEYDGTAPLELTDEDFAPFKKILGDKTAPAAIHALMEYSRYLNASAEDRAKFSTALYLEADGVTDGPINALVNLTAGSFKASWIDLVNRGGLYLGSTSRSLADYIGQKKAPFGNGEVDTTEDLYQLSTNFFESALSRLKAVLAGEKKTYANINDALTRVLADLLPDMKFDVDTGQLKFQRGIAKNPLTVTVYGSGVRGIANKITAMALEELYERYPTDADMPSQLVQDLKFLTTYTLGHSQFGYSMKKVEDANLTVKTGVEFTLSRSMIKSLEANIQTMFAKPLTEAIGEVMGDAMRTATILRQATQTQSIFFKYAYRQAIADALANKSSKDGTRAEDFLSQNELGDIFNKLIKRFPMIETKSQRIWVGGSARADIETSEFGRGTDESFRTPGYVYGPENSGVSGIPFLVIATGDGQMILNALTGEEAPQGILPVFDGINMKLDTIGPDSVKINKAVYDGWLENPIRAVEKSFTTFLENGGIEDANAPIGEDMLEELVRAFSDGPGFEMISPEFHLRDIHSDLRRVANELDARKAVMSKINMSVDHMASAGSPYVKTDGVELPADPVAAEQILNEMLAVEMAKLPEAEPLKIYQKPSEDIASFLGSIGETDSSGAKIIDREQLREMVDKLNIPLDQKSLFRGAVNSFATQGWTVLFGNPEQLQSYAQANDIKLPYGFEGNNGLALPGDKTVFLMSANSETLTHEMIHAATAGQVFAHYSGQNVHKDVPEAIQRIEALMGDFLSIDPSTIEDKETQSEFVFAKAQIEKINAGTNLTRALQKTAALNEFMAWTLANQKLADLARGTKVTNKLGLIVKAVMDKLKKIWRAGLAPTAQDDVYSNLRFNTLLLMQAKPKTVLDVSKMSGLAQFQARKYGTNNRLNQVEAELNGRMSGLIEQARASSRVAHGRVLRDHIKMRDIANKVATSFQANGFNLTQQEDSLFRTLVQAFALDKSLDGNAQSRIQDMFRHVLSTLKVEDFMADPNTQDPAARYAAQQKYDLVVGNYFVGKDLDGRSTLVPAFLALSVVSDEFRDVLNKLPAPKELKLAGKSLDTTLTNFGIEAMDRLARAMSGEGTKSGNLLSAMDLLTDRLAQSQTDREAYIEQFTDPVGNGVDNLNQWLVDASRKQTQNLADKLTNVRENTNSKAVKLAANAAETVLGILNPDISEKLANGYISLLNKGDVPIALRELVSEVVGRTNENAPIFDMIKKSRALIQQLRQIYRERLPAIIAEKFTRPLKPKEWENLYNGLAKTDIAALRPLGSKTVLDVLKDGAKLKQQVSQIENEIAQLDPTHSAKLLTKARELSVYMNTGKASSNLLRNADAIAHLFGELPTGIRKRRGTPSQGLVSAVDKLVTLYALGSLPTATRASMATLSATEAAGMEFTIAYLNGQRDNELSKDWSEKAKFNHYKGYVPTETRSGASLVVSDDKHYQDLVTRGYTRVGNYNGSAAERGMGQRGYYFAPLTGKSAFNQGIAQNIRHTFYGVDPVTGFSLDSYGAGRITDQAKVAAIVAQRSRNGNQKEALLPVYDADGDVIGFERTLDPVQLNRLEREQDLSKVLGIWRGRQEEEGMADEFNRQLVRRLHDVWAGKEFGRKDEFVNLLDPESHKDPVITDAIKLLSPAMRKDIESVFGSDGFMVRKDMINDAVGYRSPSIGDAWTGVTRVSPEMTKVIQNVATAVIGPKAYQYLVTGEKLWQNFVSDARTTIVVRSVIVPAANLISNMYQLASRGVPLKDIARGMPKKLAEVHAYHQNHMREIKLEAEILANKNNVVKLRPLKAELKSIQDSHKRLTIWPLIEAGEFTSVSEATVMREESTLFEGKMSQYIEGLVDKLPDSVRTAGKYAIISRDTALFQGLQRAVEYGDFLAKAVLYDELTKRKGMSSEKALAQISEEYVNYDRLPGRFRGSLESMGLLWFYHFKLRSIKVAMSMIRNNPLHTLMVGLTPAPEFLGSVGLPVSDNALAIAYENKLGWSVGPVMGLHAQAMNPWANLVL